jgi:hypothetical protein
MIGSRPSNRAVQGSFFSAGALASVCASQICASSYSRRVSLSLYAVAG